MATVTFTDVTVRSLTAGTYFDSRTTGFCMRVGKKRRTWFVVRGNKRATTVIGAYPEITLFEARSLALKLLAEPHRVSRTTLTFAEVRERYLAEHPGRPSTKKELFRLLTRRFAELDGKPITAVTDRDIERQIAPAARSEGLHAFRAARALFRWAQRPPRRYIVHSPLEGYAPPGQDGRATRIVSDDEVKRLLGANVPQCGAIIRLMLLWGVKSLPTATPFSRPILTP